MIGGAVLLFLSLPTLIAAPFWIGSLAAAENDGVLGCGLPLLAFVAALAWMGWTLLPPFRRAELTLRPDSVAIGAYGWRHDIPWPAVRTLRIEMIRVAHRLPGNGPSRTWHVIATADQLNTVAAPLDTFHTDLDQIIAAFRRVAPETVELELVGYRRGDQSQTAPAAE